MSTLAPPITDRGILVLGDETRETRIALKQMGMAREHADAPSMPWERTLLWLAPTSRHQLRVDLLKPGFDFLERWQVAAPLLSLSLTAADLGSAEERARTESVVRDLRIPAYSTAMLFLRRCKETAKLLERWAAEMAPGCDSKLAFLRAAYVCRPLILALPPTWLDGSKAPNIARRR